MDEKQERQREFFKEFLQPTKLAKKPLGDDTARKIHTITLSNEQLIFAFIGLIILLVTCFSLGVERGKRIVAGKQWRPEEEAVAEKGVITEEKMQVALVKEKTQALVEPQAPVKPQRPVKLQSPVEPQAPVKLQRPVKDNKVPEKITVAQKKTLPFAVQVAAYTGNNQAEKEKRLLESKGYGVEIAKSGKYFVIYVVGFADRKEAGIALEKLRERYKDCFVRKRR